MMPARMFLVPAFILVLAAAGPDVEELLVEMRPEPGVVARVFRQLDHKIELRQPFGHDIPLQRPGGGSGLGKPGPELRRLDVDFDGHADLAVHFPEAKSDDPLQIIRYRPDRRHYETLQLPRAPELRCDWRDAVPDPGDRSLNLSCQRGASRVTERVRFNRFGAPWLDTRLTEGGLMNAARYPYIPMASRLSRWDEAGIQQEVEARDSDGEPVFLTIPVPQASLYEGPDHRTQTRTRLVRGDRVQLRDQLADWLRISHEGASATPERWIWIPEAFDLAARIGFDDSAADRGLVLSAGAPETESTTGTLGDIFPLTLTNSGDGPQDPSDLELHILFSSENDEDGWALTLGNRETTMIAPGESVVLEQGPLIIIHGAYLLAHPMPNEVEDYIELFPFDLIAGTYSARAALTSPLLDAPLYSAGRIVFHHPPGSRPAKKPER